MAERTETSERIKVNITETSQRYRINVSQTSTGKKSWDCTVEMEGSTMEEVLAKSDALVVELERRYPPEVEKKAVKPSQHEGLGSPLEYTP